MAYRYLGSATTNANGVAELNFTGTGRGELDIVASTSRNITSSSLVSETYEIWDTLFYDIGTTGTINPKWYYNGGTFISSNAGLKFTNDSATGYIIAPNLSGKANPTMVEMALFSDGTEVQFMIVDKTATIDLQTRDVNGNLTHHYLTDIITPNITLTYKNGSVSVKANNTPIGTAQSQNGNVQIRMTITNGYFEFKDFRVYTI